MKNNRKNHTACFSVIFCVVIMTAAVDFLARHLKTHGYFQVVFIKSVDGKLIKKETVI